METEEKRYLPLELWVKRTQIWANVFICIQLGLIIIALLQYADAKAFNKKQIRYAENNELIAARNELSKNAIEAINRIYNPGFLKSFAGINEKSSLADKNTREDYMIVLNNYYIVAVVYNSGIADKQLIEESIRNGIVEFTGYDIYRLDHSASLGPAKKAIDKMIHDFKTN